jgi:dTDP-4-dehydrorhamnose 3,5-epimerase
MGDSMMEGVLLTPQKRIFHPDGDILHAMKASADGYAGFGEAYFSTILKDHVKGWKRHNRLVLNIVVPVGSIYFVICDDRGDKKGRPEFFQVCLNRDNYARLTIAPGLWVSFKGKDESNMLMNIIAEEHDMAESDNIPVDEIEYDFSIL